MEKDDEIKGQGNSYTTQFRKYDPRIGKWLSLDPLMAKYPDQSPYAAFNNNPIYFADPTGLEGDPKPKDKGKKEGEVNEFKWQEWHFNCATSQVTNYIWHSGTENGAEEGWYTETEYLEIISLQARNYGQLLGFFNDWWPNSEEANARNQGDYQYYADFVASREFADGYFEFFETYAKKLGDSYLSQRAYQRSGHIWMDDTPALLISGVGLLKEAAKKVGTGIIRRFFTRESTFYRAMSDDAAAVFMKTGKMPAGTETFISPTKSFAQNYSGTLFKIKVNSNVISQLQSIGVRNVASAHPMGHLPLVSRGWKGTNAFFKVEGAQMNIGLGNGNALNIFNSNIRSFKVIK